MVFFVVVHDLASSPLLEDGLMSYPMAAVTVQHRREIRMRGRRG